MQSVINHIANSAQLALEGSLRYTRSLHIIGQYEVTFIADIDQNFCEFELVFYERPLASQKRNEVACHSIKTDKLWSYNTADMAKATVEFLLCQLLYKTMHDPYLPEGLEFVKELQDRFDEAFNIQIAIV